MARSTGETAGTFERRIGALLLDAYAAGDEVEGEWYLMDMDPMVPDVTVLVRRVDQGQAVPATREDVTFSPVGPRDFKTRLQEFVLERFASGGDLEGSWTVRYARDSLPEWQVDISTSTDPEVGDPGDGIVSKE